MVPEPGSVLAGWSSGCRVRRSRRLDGFLDSVRGLFGSGFDLFGSTGSGILGGVHGTGSGVLGSVHGTGSSVLDLCGGFLGLVSGGFCSCLGGIGGSGSGVLDGFLGTGGGFAGLLSGGLGGTFNLGGRLFAGRENESSGSECGE